MAGSTDDTAFGLEAAQWHEYDSVDAMTAALADELARTCERAVAEHGRALLALAGGRTPLPLYRALAAMPLPWSRIVLVPTDDRCVPHEHAACNLSQIAAAFEAADGATMLPLTAKDGDAEVSAAIAIQALEPHRSQAFDAVVLGMGNDAHTASLFPHASQLAQAMKPSNSLDACRLDPIPLPPEAPFPRITLTRARLQRARALHLVISGAEKRDVLERARASDDRMSHPIAAVLDAPAAQVHLHWSP
ncbi:MAG: 6-phosphogluconolactonase, eukaryotic type [uncultured Lysobacter sp.]|uniref:6-phosphogluconolactonase n=1 Tax=uncultured Lysobacter sp. TaxID=271060 RepID=A0A6J4LIF0_9GAMM|nr:MAG: 6-phosphogluconolactonase, eukaryotic type [uncultured Lysobacter sp.]